MKAQLFRRHGMGTNLSLYKAKTHLGNPDGWMMGNSPNGTGTPRGPDGCYGGGSRYPYVAGHSTPSGLMPFYVSASASWMPYDWGPNGEYCYPLNHTGPALPNNPAGNTTDPILCICLANDVCGCDNKNGTYTIPLSAKYALINGTETVVVNGTLADGTTAPSEATSAQSSANIIRVSTTSATCALWVAFTLMVLLADELL